MKRKISKVFKDFLKKEMTFYSYPLSLIACKEEDIFCKFLEIVEKNKLKALFFSPRKPDVKFSYIKSIYPVDIQNIFKMFNDKFINFYNLVIIEFLSVNILKEFLLHFERKKIRSHLNFVLFLKTLFLSRYKENVLTCFQ